jgi:hypothetical protein
MSPVEDQARRELHRERVRRRAEYLARRHGEYADRAGSSYFNQRLWDDCVRDDVGASVSDGIRVVSRAGVPREASWPYARELFAVQPTEAVYREAARMKAHDWWSVPVDGDSAARLSRRRISDRARHARHREPHPHTGERLCGLTRRGRSRPLRACSSATTIDTLFVVRNS